MCKDEHVEDLADELYENDISEEDKARHQHRANQLAKLVLDALLDGKVDPAVGELDAMAAFLRIFGDGYSREEGQTALGLSLDMVADLCVMAGIVLLELADRGVLPLRSEKEDGTTPKIFPASGK